MNLIDVRLYLQETLTEPFYFYLNSGNAGDALMAMATFETFGYPLKPGQNQTLVA